MVKLETVLVKFKGLASPATFFVLVDQARDHQAHVDFICSSQAGCIDYGFSGIFEGFVWAWGKP